MDAIPSGAIHFFRHFNLVGRNFLADGQIFIGDIDIKKKPCSNRHIRNALSCVTLSAAKFFWSSTPPGKNDGITRLGGCSFSCLIL